MRTRMSDLEAGIQSEREMDRIGGGAGNGEWSSDWDLDFDSTRYSLTYHDFDRSARWTVFAEVGYDLNPEFDLDPFSLSLDPEFDRIMVGISIGF